MSTSDTRPGPDGRHASLVRRGLALTAMAGLLAAGATAVAGSASADPSYPSAKQVEKAKGAVRSASQSVASLEAQLAVASAQLDQLQTQVQVAAEAYDVARIELDKRTAAAAAAHQQAERAQRDAQEASEQAGRLAVDTYINGPGYGGLEVFVSDAGPADLLRRAAGARIAGDIAHTTVERASAARVVAALMRRQADLALAQQQAAAGRLEQARKAAEAKAQAAEAERQRIEGERTQMIAQLASLKKTSVKLEAERQQGLEEAARQRAEARRKAEAEAAARRERARREAQDRADRPSRDTPSRGGGSDSGGASADTGGGSSRGSSSAGAAALAWAKTQIGKDYQWGADGPSTYDCSGLTMQAWARQGVSLPHSSTMQYSVTKHVSIDDLRPGDLVFFATDTSNPSTIHHVAIYAGGGQMVEAPYTGAQVRISSIYRSGLMAYGGRP
ncbi:MAG TPA: C40 family peptidase [Actinomycetales bacterium]|nr:C40 family peptidase [Actinomycetales bacterium]